MKWFKEHTGLIAIALVVIGITILCVMAYNGNQPAMTIDDGTIATYRTSAKVMVIGFIAFICIVVGGIIAVKNEARAYYNQKSFFDTLGIKNNRKR